MRFILALAAILLALPSGARAAAIAAVDTNFFSLTPFYGVDKSGNRRALAPSEVTFSIVDETLTPVETILGNATAATSGDATINGSTLFASVAASASASRPGYAFASVELEVHVAIQVARSPDLLAVAILTNFSAFNPGGNPVGAAVDDVSLEFARFDSRQFGEGIGDLHSCDTRFVDGSHFPASPPAAQCGVASPDSSQDEFSFVVPESRIYELVYRLTAEAEASAVPEPAALALFGSALLGLIASRRRG